MKLKELVTEQYRWTNQITPKKIPPVVYFAIGADDVTFHMWTSIKAENHNDFMETIFSRERYEESAIEVILKTDKFWKESQKKLIAFMTEMQKHKKDADKKDFIKAIPDAVPALYKDLVYTIIKKIKKRGQINYRKNLGTIQYECKHLIYKAMIESYKV